MKIDVVTIFPEICLAPLRESIPGRAQSTGAVEIEAHDLREFTHDRHRQVDDEPYGGGPGMVMKPEPFYEAVQPLKGEGTRTLLLTPQGKPLSQAMVREFAEEEHLILLCGHYEGVDQRVIDGLVDDEVSIGDYILTNGTLAAAVLIDAVVRLLPGVLGDERSSEQESFTDPCLLEGPHYTRPVEFEGMEVPEILRSGHHGNIEAWRREQGEEKTKRMRPDLWDRYQRGAGH